MVRQTGSLGDIATRRLPSLVAVPMSTISVAWANRRVMTPSELRLWSALKARQLGVQFRREVPLLGRFIVDFCAPSVRLVVEVDGECHLERRAADARRDAALRARGIACSGSKRSSSSNRSAKQWR